MKLSQALAVLSRLPVSESQAVDVQTLCQRVPGMSLRTMQRYMEELSGSDSEYRPAALVRRLEDAPSRGSRPSGGRAPKHPGRAYRYCLDTAALRRWFMTDHMALNLLLADQAVGASLGESTRMGGSGLAAQAAHLVQEHSPETRRIAAYVRIVPDGLGRRPARIDPAVVDAVLDAIALGRQLRFAYASASGKRRQREVSPRGLVAKDGTLYLVATQELSDPPLTFALQRASQAEVSARPIPPREFDIDRYLEETQHLSHPLQHDPAIELQLQVAPEMVYHFRERPLWNQTLGEPQADGRVRVTARVPDSVTLTPFLLSMSPWVEVLGPPQVRDRVRERLEASVRLYRHPQAAGDRGCGD